MCVGTSCATCAADDLTSPCKHDEVDRHRGVQRVSHTRPRTPSPSRVPTKPLPGPLLADRIEVDPADPDSLAHFLETWAHIVRTRRRFAIILQ